MSHVFSCAVNLLASALSLQVSSSPVPSHLWQQQELTGRPSDIWKHKNMRRDSSTADNILLLRNRSRKKRKWGTNSGFYVRGFGYPSSTQTSTVKTDCAPRNNSYSHCFFVHRSTKWTLIWRLIWAVCFKDCSLNDKKGLSQNRSFCFVLTKHIIKSIPWTIGPT